jgi:hypothetical protein
MQSFLDTKSGAIVDPDIIGAAYAIVLAVAPHDSERLE